MIISVQPIRKWAEEWREIYIFHKFLLFVLKACELRHSRKCAPSKHVYASRRSGRRPMVATKHTPSKHCTHTTKQAGKIFCSCWLVKLEAVNKEFCSKFVSSGSSSYSVIEPKSVISSSLQSKRGMSHLDECSILTSKTQSKRHKR